MLETHGHGGHWAHASRTFGLPEDAWLDYSANINPMGPPEGVRETLANEWSRLTRYPDPDAGEFRQAVSAKYGVDADAILAANGAAEAIDLAVRHFQPKKGAVIAPTFSEYGEALRRAGATVEQVPASELNGFAVPLERLLAVCGNVDLLVVGQPNNPTGTWMARSDLLRLIEHAEKLQTAVIVDEAFLDFFDHESGLTLMTEAPRHPRVAVLRSLTKFYALPGLRIGYAVAHPETIRGMRSLQIPWSVNHLAQKAGIAALADEEYAAATRSLIRTESGWLRERLEKLGCTVSAGKANFVLAKLPASAPDVAALQRGLARQGILIRSCLTFDGLDHRYMRLAVRSRADNERLVRALAEWLRPGEPCCGEAAK